MTISLSSFTTARNPDGTYSLTLAQLTSVFLTEIETLLGPRDSKFTYVGLEIDETPNASPRIWFPHSGHPVREQGKRSEHVIIRLTEKAQTDANLAIWQLAHECVNLIDPWNIDAEGRPTNLLEEGLAAWYQHTIVHGIPLDPPYAEAKALVDPHMPNLATAIRHIRTDHKIRIGDIEDPDLLMRHCREMDSKIAENLCLRFSSTEEQS